MGRGRAWHACAWLKEGGHQLSVFETGGILLPAGDYELALAGPSMPAYHNSTATPDSHVRPHTYTRTFTHIGVSIYTHSNTYTHTNTYMHTYTAFHALRTYPQRYSWVARGGRGLFGSIAGDAECAGGVGQHGSGVAAGGRRRQ
jgi:hypothetical protein